MSEQFFAYKFTDPTRDYTFANVAHALVMEGEVYAPSTSISHTPPTYSSDPSQARVSVRLRDDLAVALNYISHPPPFSTELRIWEVLDVVPSGNQLLVTRAEPHWSGKVVRVAWRDSFRAVEMVCKTRQEIYFGREALTQGLDPLCRFHLGDGRCPVNIENFKESAVVVNVSGDISEPTVEVSGLSQVNTYYKGGMLRTADLDWRTVELAATSGGNKLLTLNRAFALTAIQAGDTVDVFAGDDLTIETCSVKFGAETNSGEAWGGWKLTPSRDFARDGIK